MEGYALPIADVQLRIAETRMALLSHAYATDDHVFTWNEVGCVTDPFSWGCPPIKGINDKRTVDAQKK